jgi:hypothetical protein
MDFSGASGANFRVVQLPVGSPAYLAGEAAGALTALAAAATAQGVTAALGLPALSGLVTQLHVTYATPAVTFTSPCTNTVVTEAAPRCGAPWRSGWPCSPRVGGWSPWLVAVGECVRWAMDCSRLNAAVLACVFLCLHSRSPAPRTPWTRCTMAWWAWVARSPASRPRSAGTPPTRAHGTFCGHLPASLSPPKSPPLCLAPFAVVLGVEDWVSAAVSPLEPIAIVWSVWMGSGSGDQVPLRLVGHRRRLRSHRGSERTGRLHHTGLRAAPLLPAVATR